MKRKARASLRIVFTMKDKAMSCARCTLVVLLVLSAIKFPLPWLSFEDQDTSARPSLGVCTCFGDLTTANLREELLQFKI
ncbi:hypothetical protein O9993_14145 [Vibrio lentus]|nr:hypothetical protein [Vibrio lentus]